METHLGFFSELCIAINYSPPNSYPAETSINQNSFSFLQEWEYLLFCSSLSVTVEISTFLSQALSWVSKENRPDEVER